MKISILKNSVEKNHFNIELSDTSFVATSLGVFFNVSREELIRLVDFANAELQDSGADNVA